MNPKKKISSIEMVGSNVHEFQTALTKLVGAARLAAPVKDWFGSSMMDVQDSEGQELASVDLIEETLTDGSKVYNIELRFSNVE